MATATEKKLTFKDLMRLGFVPTYEQNEGELERAFTEREAIPESERGTYLPGIEQQKRWFAEDTGKALEKQQAGTLKQALSDLMLQKIAKEKENLKKPTVMEQVFPEPKTEIVEDKKTKTYRTQTIPQEGMKASPSLKQGLVMGMKPGEALKYARDEERYQQKLMAYRKSPHYQERRNLALATLGELGIPIEGAWNDNLDWWDNFNNIVGNVRTDVQQQARVLFNQKLKSDNPEYTKGKALKEKAGLATAKEKLTYLSGKEKEAQGKNISDYETYLDQFTPEEEEKPKGKIDTRTLLKGTGNVIKSKSGRMMQKDPNSPTGWSYVQ